MYFQEGKVLFSLFTTWTAFCHELQALACLPAAEITEYFNDFVLGSQILLIVDPSFYLDSYCSNIIWLRTHVTIVHCD